MTKAEAVLEANSESTAKSKKSTETNSNMGVSTKGAPTSEAALVVKLQDDQSINDEAVVNGSQDVKSPIVVKRGRGRPRKNAENVATPSPTPVTTTPTPRGRGVRGSVKGGRGRGRGTTTPETTPTPGTSEQPIKKRGRGRPPKCKTEVRLFILSHLAKLVKKIQRRKWKIFFKNVRIIINY